MIIAPFVCFQLFSIDCFIYIKVFRLGWNLLQLSIKEQILFLCNNHINLTSFKLKKLSDMPFRGAKSIRRYGTCRTSFFIFGFSSSYCRKAKVRQNRDSGSNRVKKPCSLADVNYWSQQNIESRSFFRNETLLCISKLFTKLVTIWYVYMGQLGLLMSTGDKHY